MEKFIGFRAMFQEGDSQHFVIEAPPPALWLTASAHERFAAAADYFLVVRTDGERNACFAHDLAQSVCTPHKHEACVLSQHVLRP